MSIEETTIYEVVNELVGMVLVVPVSKVDKDGKTVKESKAFKVDNIFKDVIAGTTHKAITDEKEVTEDRTVDDEKTVNDGKTVKDEMTVKDGRAVEVDKRVQKTEEPKEDLITNNSKVSLLAKEDNSNTDLKVLQAVRNTHQRLMTLVEYTVQLEAKFKQTAQSSNFKKDKCAFNLPIPVPNPEKSATTQIKQNCNLGNINPMLCSPKLVPNVKKATPTKTTLGHTSIKEINVLNLPCSENPTQITQSYSSPKENPVLCPTNSVQSPENPTSILEKQSPHMNNYKVTIISQHSNEIIIKLHRNSRKYKPNAYSCKERHKKKMSSKFPTTKQMNENTVPRNEITRDNSILLKHGIETEYFSAEKPSLNGVGSYSSSKPESSHVKLESNESYTKLNSGIPSTYYFSPFVKKQPVNSVSLPEKKKLRFPEAWGQIKNRKLRPSMIDADDIEIE